MAKKNVRYLALDLLVRIEKQGSFSHLLLSQMIQKAKLGPQDERLLTEIVYGTIERKLTLDYYLQPFIKSPKKVTDWVMTLLRMSVFQLEFLDKVPEYAIINEAVEIAKEKGHKGIVSFVNGVLRNVLRKGVPNVDEITDRIEKLSVSTSHPKWLVARWVEQYGYETAKQICETNLEKKPISLRVNQLKTSKEEVLQLLKKEGIKAHASPYIEDSIIVSEGNVLKTNLIEEGLVTIQDQSSMLAGRVLQAEPGMTVLDTCSAPGGKATYIGEMMKNKGKVHAHDLHQNKINLIKKNAIRLGITNINAAPSDARKLQEKYNTGSFDRILVDAPCSGLGVIRSKPDIKYNKQLDDINKLHVVQLEILNEVAPLLTEDGKLVYSTCTIDREENEEVIRKFLNEHQEFTVDETFFEEVSAFENGRITKYGLQLFPHTIQSDGFFITRLIKKEL